MFKMCTVCKPDPPLSFLWSCYGLKCRLHGKHFEIYERSLVVGAAADFVVFAVFDVAIVCVFFVMVLQLLMMSLLAFHN